MADRQGQPTVFFEGYGCKIQGNIQVTDGSSQARRTATEQANPTVRFRLPSMEGTWMDLGSFYGLPYEKIRVAVSKEDLEGSKAGVSFGVPSGVEIGVTVMVDTSDRSLLPERGAESKPTLLSHVVDVFSKGLVCAVKTPMHALSHVVVGRQLTMGLAMTKATPIVSCVQVNGGFSLGGEL
ncbi:hypothetical protein NE237_007423 [Protea cynaroides]|uniref:Uncharacterized protein n=1 Tax=Protea cynaroides TaxID=273540 RepID=A0A9Q0QWH1_9MAGN|nr:hypothetical protein NE237_007423 [Protea cynaroides]